MTKEEIEYHNKLWYYKTYNQLIDKCIKMESEGYSEEIYTEVHHILPKCMGGTNDKNNLVRMPVKYHIIAHLLLNCIYPDNFDLIKAAILMTTTRDGERVSTRIISRLRIESSMKQKQKIVSEDTRRKISTSRKGIIYSIDTRKKMSESKKGNKNPNFGKSLSKEHREKISISNKGKVISEKQRKAISLVHKGVPLTEEHKLKISRSEKGRVFSEEHKEKIRQTNLKNRHIWTKRVQGPDGTIYESLKDCYTSIGKSKKTVMRWVNYRPEKGYKYID